jgi:hypothetical protein
LGVVTDIEVLEVLPSSSKPSSSQIGSRIGTEVSSRLEQTGKTTEGQELGMENKVDLPFIGTKSLFRRLQVGECRKDLAQSKVGDCKRRREKSLPKGHVLGQRHDHWNDWKSVLPIA